MVAADVFGYDVVILVCAAVVNYCVVVLFFVWNSSIVEAVGGVLVVITWLQLVRMLKDLSCRGA